jgi:hypothetical protein
VKTPLEEQTELVRKNVTEGITFPHKLTKDEKENHPVIRETLIRARQYPHQNSFTKLNEGIQILQGIYTKA